MNYTLNASKVHVFPLGTSCETHCIALWQFSSVGSTSSDCHFSQVFENAIRLNLQKTWKAVTYVRILYDAFSISKWKKMFQSRPAN